MSNKKVLSQATRGLNKAKAPSKSRDIIYDPMGQWAHPGQNTRIPSRDITMQGVPYPVWAQPNVGQPQMMQPGQEYNFPEADYVDEYPQMKRGGYMKGLVPMPKPSKKGLASKAYSRSLDATNRLFTENTLFKKPKDRKRKVFDPNAKYYAEGGFIETELTDEEIQAYKDGGYIVEDISIPTLEYQKGGASNDDPWKKIMKTTQKKIIESAKVKKDWRRAHDEAPNLNYQNTNQKAPVKKLSPEDKKRQENFDKNFGVEGKDNYTKFKDKVQENLKLWADQRDNYADYADNEWEAAVEDLTQREWNEDQYNATKNTTRKVIVPDVDGVGQHWETWYPDDSLVYSSPFYKYDPTLPKRTNAEDRILKRRWDEKNALERFYIKEIGYPLGLEDTGSPYPDRNYVGGPPQLAEDMTGIGRSKMFIKGAKYLMPKVKQVANYFLKENGGTIDNNQMLELQEGGIYTYAGRKDSKYKKDSNGNWLINNSSTGNKFIPIKDPTGERTMQLNKNAKSENSIDLSNISPNRSSSESTDTQGYKLLNKQLSEDKLNKQYQIHNEKQAAVDNYVEYIKKQKPFGKDTKKNKEYQDKAISDIRNKFIKNPDQAYTIAYNSTSHNKDIKALPKGSVKTGPSAYDVLTNPFDAFKYSVMTGDVSNMPANYNKFKRAGINPLDSHGGNLVGDQLNTMLNPVDMLDKTVHNINEGNYGTAGLHALRFVPFLKSAPVTKVLSGAKKVMAPVENVLSQPLINPSLINEYVTSNPTALNIAKNLTGSKVLGMEAAYKAANMTPEVTKAAYDAYTNSGKDSWKKLLEKTTKLVMNSSPIFSELKNVSPILSQVNNVVSDVKPYYSVLKNTAKSEEKPNDIDAKDILSTVRSIPKLGLEKLGGEPNSMETELTDAEIEQLRKQGYVIELI